MATAALLRRDDRGFESLQDYLAFISIVDISAITSEFFGVFALLRFRFPLCAATCRNRMRRILRRFIEMHTTEDPDASLLCCCLDLRVVQNANFFTISEPCIEYFLWKSSLVIVRDA